VQKVANISDENKHRN